MYRATYYFGGMEMGNIAPHIPIKIDEYGVEARYGIKQLGHVIVRFDLCRIGIPAQFQ